MNKLSAGILLYKIKNSNLSLFLVHPGGPFYWKKDIGVWSIPKGEFDEDEDPRIAAKREFFEETGVTLDGLLIELTPVKLKSGKKVFAWAIEGDIDTSKIISNTFQMEWPPKSGNQKEFPEIDKGEWFSVDKAKEKIHEAQVSFIDQLIEKLNLKIRNIIGVQGTLFE